MEARAKALSQPKRLRIFVILGEREASPKELSEELGEKLHTVMYHVDWLAGKKPANSVPLIELVEIDHKRGGPQHIYRAIERPFIDFAAAAKMSRPAREDSTAVSVPMVIDDIRRAQKAGTFDDHPQRSVLRLHAELDDEGMNESARAAESYVRTLENIAGRSKNRIANGTKGFPVATETLVFPAPKLY
jgi:DNA-binding transcriptional ArsR family regulator